jgi:hypothetical protein
MAYFFHLFLKKTTMTNRNKRRRPERVFNEENFGDYNNNDSTGQTSHGYHNPDYEKENFWQEHDYENRNLKNVNERYRADTYPEMEDDYQERRNRNEHSANNYRNLSDRERRNPNLDQGYEEEGYDGRNERDYQMDYQKNYYYRPGEYDPGELKDDYNYQNYSHDRADRTEDYDYFESVPSYHRRESRERSYLNPLYANENAFPEGRYSTSRYEFENWGDGRRKRNTRDERLENYRRKRPNIRENRN